jgi:hypothetical protein
VLESSKVEMNLAYSVDCDANICLSTRSLQVGKLKGRNYVTQTIMWIKLFSRNKGINYQLNETIRLKFSKLKKPISRHDEAQCDSSLHQM